MTQKSCNYKGIGASSKMGVDALEKNLVMSPYSLQGRLSEAEKLQPDIIEADNAVGPRKSYHSEKHGNFIFDILEAMAVEMCRGISITCGNSTADKHGARQFHTLSSLSDHMSVNQGQQRLKEAKNLATQVMDKTKKTLGDSPPKILNTKHDLAITYACAG